METNMEPMEEQKRGRVKDLLFTILILFLASAHIFVMLQSVGILGANHNDITQTNINHFLPSDLTTNVNSLD
ncbi:MULTISPECIES: hypothetical protein [unclassified Dehalobacter]|uniref:hypothetical protein n=1 Tax=unclassified Dehalobacter TaxID=2635733 RepID=UPI000E6CED60|nr:MULTISPECIES: hypothetical protein [unclassified Dehalobacter]RJE48655.1 hypothetical protein A7K50_10000 [Dehalobacter sp. MCB1]TCX53430.1 hypothetical protein C1I36_01355 [Dehalobacter sp. 14DCB1]TCX54445.1 hypothetical protein C1I38_06740 [Dehalobacter sp. 12DCB1]